MSNSFAIQIDEVISTEDLLGDLFGILSINFHNQPGEWGGWIGTTYGGTIFRLSRGHKLVWVHDPEHTNFRRQEKDYIPSEKMPDFLIEQLVRLGYEIGKA